MNRLTRTLTATVVALAAATVAFEASAASNNNGNFASFSVPSHGNTPGAGNNTPGTPHFRLPGSNNYPHKRPRPCYKGRHCGDGEMAKVCYYTQPNFQGASFCSKPGTNLQQLSQRWNDRISSIRIEGHAKTRICTDGQLTGQCILITGGTRKQLLSLDDSISSLVIYN